MIDIPDILISELIPEIEGLAPHSHFMTAKALGSIDGLHKMKKIADVGCGSGYQSILLKEMTQADIIAIDHRKEYIDDFRKELKRQELDKYIHPVLCQTNTLPFFEGELDMIWSESLAANIGFGQAIKRWKKYIKQGGYIGICAYCRNYNTFPDKVSAFFHKNNIGIDSISNRIIQMDELGFLPISHFIMPEECWWNYFCPIDSNLEGLTKKFPDNPQITEFTQDVNSEISLFENYGDYYSYVFFIGRKY